MIKVQTVLKIADNSGAIFVNCIRLMVSLSKKGANVGNIVTVVVKKSLIKKNVKKSKEVKNGQIFKALIVRTKKGVRRWGNFFIKSFTNAAALINKYNLPIGSRLIGPTFREIRNQSQFIKFISISQVTI